MKTYTEQWRDGTLQKGLYYTRSSSGRKGFSFHTGSKRNMFSPYDRMAHQVEEVLGPVPSYERIKDLDRLEQFCELILAGEKQEWEKIVKRGDRKEMTRWLNERKNKTVDRLEKKLEIATKALKETKDRLLKIELSNLNYEERHKLYDIMFADGVIDRALLEMEGVK